MAEDRTDVAVAGGGWDNPLLRNYALAMRALDELDLSNMRSWKFLAAMHGFDADYWRRSGVIGATQDVPASLIDNTFGDQCQHSTWYFLPWHRGYLWAFEAVVAATVKDLTGDDWALPYWNYLDASHPDARRIPEAFTVDTLWDGSPNPFLRYPRAREALPPVASHRDISLDALAESDFSVGVHGTFGLGGGKTGFAHFGDMAGDLEVNPHNVVHGMVGGFMGDPYLAGLDPLFWLHHCNIDRLWEAWMSAPGKTMTREADWMDGPGPSGRTFIMPGAREGDPATRFAARDTLRKGGLHRSYDDLTKGTGLSVGGAMVARVNMGAPKDQRVELLGANEDRLQLGSTPTMTDIALEAAATTVTVRTMGVATAGDETSRLYLAFESIRGQVPYATVDVYVNVPEGVVPEDQAAYVAGSLHLFGLNRATDPDGGHGGNGLGQTLDITDLADRLNRSGDFDPGHIRVTLVPVEGSSAQEPITFERVSVLKRSGIVSTSPR